MIELTQEITERVKAREALEKTHSELEQRVRERTCDLQRVNERLKWEIEERKEVEDVLRAQKDFLNTLIETIPSPVFYKGAHGYYTGCNSAFEDFTGKPRADIIGKTVYDMGPKEIAAKYQEKDQALFDAPGKQHYEWQMQRSDGAIRDVLFDKATLIDGNGEVGGIVGVITDITERKEFERQLQDSEQFNASLLNQSPNPIHVLFPDTAVKYVNPAFEKLTGFAASEVMGKKAPYPWWPLEDMETTREEFKTALQEGLLKHEKLFQTKTGALFWVEITSTPVKENEELKYYLSNWVDITERKKAEEALRQSEATARVLLNAPNDLVMLLDRDGLFVDINEAVCRRFHKRPEELIGRRAWDLIEPAAGIRRKAYSDQVLASGPPVHFEDERMGKWWDNTMYPVHDTTGQVNRIAVFSRDITERKKTEAQIQSLSRQLLKAHEDERQMIGRELHDSAAQDLSTLKIAVKSLFDRNAALPEDDRGQVVKLYELLDRSIVTIRNMSHDLHPPELKEIGLVPTLATYCEEYGTISGIDVDFQASGLAETELDFFIQINIYRLVQEALNNIRKHAEARRASIRLIGAHPNVILRIEDDGKGFDVEARQRALDQEKRLGLRSMKERVSLLQGQMAIRSRPGQGTRIHVKFPNRKE